MDVPKDIQQQLDIPDWDQPMHISGYISRLPPQPNMSLLAEVIEAIKGSSKPVGAGWCDSLGAWVVSVAGSWNACGDTSTLAERSRVPYQGMQQAGGCVSSI